MYNHPCTIWSSIRSALRPNAALVVILLCTAGCDMPGKPDPANKPVSPDQIVDFKQLFSANCAGCHGATGKLGPAPPLNDPLFAAIVPDEELLRVIRDGRTGTPMPPFVRANGGSLTDAQVKILAVGIKSHWSSEKPIESMLPTYAVTKNEGSTAASGDHARRMEIYERACAGCHGQNGSGAGPSDMRVGAINVPAFLALISDQALRRIIITGRPDLGMPNYAEKRGRSPDYRPLSSAEIEELVALLAEWRSAGNIALAKPN